MHECNVLRLGAPVLQLSRSQALWRCLRQNLSDLLDYMFANGETGGLGSAARAFNWKLLGPSTDGSNTKDLLFSQGSGPGGADIGGEGAAVVEGDDEDGADDVRRGELCQSSYGLGRVASDRGKVLESWFVVHRSAKIIRGHISQVSPCELCNLDALALADASRTC